MDIKWECTKTKCFSLDPIFFFSLSPSSTFPYLYLFIYFSFQLQNRSTVQTDAQTSVHNSTRLAKPPKNERHRTRIDASFTPSAMIDTLLPSPCCGVSQVACRLLPTPPFFVFERGCRHSAMATAPSPSLATLTSSPMMIPLDSLFFFCEKIPTFILGEK